MDPFEYARNFEDIHYVKGFEKYQNTGQFYELLQKSKVSDGNILDLNQLWEILSAVLNKYHRLLDENDTQRNAFHGKILLSEIWRSVPFLDSKIVLDRMDKYGLPICLTAEATVPSGDHADSFFKVDIKSDLELSKRMAIPTVIMMELICRALGLQAFFTDSPEEDVQQLLEELIEAGQRSRMPDTEKLV